MSDSCDPMDCSLPGSSVHRILQAWILEWIAISFSRGSSQRRNWTWVSCIAGRFSSDWAMREATWVYLYYLATPSPEFFLSELTRGLPPSRLLLPPAMFSGAGLHLLTSRSLSTHSRLTSLFSASRAALRSDFLTAEYTGLPAILSPSVLSGPLLGHSFLPRHLSLGFLNTSSPYLYLLLLPLWLLYKSLHGRILWGSDPGCLLTS